MPWTNSELGTLRSWDIACDVNGIFAVVDIGTVDCAVVDTSNLNWLDKEPAPLKQWLVKE